MKKKLSLVNLVEEERKYKRELLRVLVPVQEDNYAVLML